MNPKFFTLFCFTLTIKILTLWPKKKKKNPAKFNLSPIPMPQALD